MKNKRYYPKGTRGEPPIASGSRGHPPRINADSWGDRPGALIRINATKWQYILAQRLRPEDTE